MKNVILSVAIIASIFSSCSEYPIRGKLYYKAMYGDKWPFPFDTIDVYCVGYKKVYGDHAGTIYAINGNARNELRFNPQIKDIFDDMLDDPNLPGAKIGIPSEFISEALKKCEE